MQGSAASRLPQPQAFEYRTVHANAHLYCDEILPYYHRQAISERGLRASSPCRGCVTDAAEARMRCLFVWTVVPSVSEFGIFRLCLVVLAAVSPHIFASSSSKGNVVLMESNRSISPFSSFSSFMKSPSSTFTNDEKWHSKGSFSPKESRIWLVISQLICCFAGQSSRLCRQLPQVLSAFRGTTYVRFNEASKRTIFDGEHRSFGSAALTPSIAGVAAPVQ